MVNENFISHFKSSLAEDFMSFGSLHLFLNNHSFFAMNHEKSDEDEVFLV